MRGLIRSTSVVLLLAAGAVAWAGPVTPGGISLPSYTKATGADQHLNKAFDLFRENKLAECRARLEIAVKNHPNLPPVDLMMAQLLLRNSRVADGRRLLESAAVATPDHPEVYLAFADQALSEGRLSDAALNIETAARLEAPKQWSDAQKSSLKQHLFRRRTMVAERRKNWKKAEQVLNEWLAADPKDVSVRQRLARALFYVGKKENALSELKRIEKADAKATPAEVGLAGLYAQAGDFQAAEKLLAERLTKDPSDRRVLMPLAHVRHIMGNSASAWTLATKAAEAGDESAELRLLRGAIARRLNKIEIALDLVNSVYQASPDNFEAANLLAQLLADSDDPDKLRTALRLAESNVRQFPQSAAALATCGWACYRNERLFDAEQLLSSARKLAPRDPEIAYQLSRVLLTRGKSDQASQLRGELKAILLENPTPFPQRDEAAKWANKQ